jgi:biopolymer transport protein ExbD
MNVRLRRPKNSRPWIPVSSTGDIAFLVIIFFMTTSVFSRDKGLKLQLPADTVRIRDTNLVTVRVGADGMVLIGDREEPVAVSEVRAIIAEKLGINPNLCIALKVSRQASYSAMIEVLDELRMAGAERLSLIPVLGTSLDGESSSSARPLQNRRLS